MGTFSLLACAMTTEDGNMESREERRGEMLYRGKHIVHASGIVEHIAHIPASKQEKENTAFIWGWFF